MKNTYINAVFFNVSNENGLDTFADKVQKALDCELFYYENGREIGVVTCGGSPSGKDYQFGMGGGNFDLDHNVVLYSEPATVFVMFDDASGSRCVQPVSHR